VLRRQVKGGEVDTRRAALALADLAALPLRRAPHRPLLARCWELRDNLTIYDASYVALAEALDVTLLAGDGRLARAPGPRCHVEILRLPFAGIISIRLESGSSRSAWSGAPGILDSAEFCSYRQRCERAGLRGCPADP